MRPYRFKMRLSSRRLNVTRLGNGPAAALRAAARASLGSASSDIELMERLLVISRNRHDRANCGPLQEGRGEGLPLPRVTDCPPDLNPASGQSVTGSLAEIIIPPNFRPATALLDCE